MACVLSDSIEIVGDFCDPDNFPENCQQGFTQIKVPEVVTIPEQKPDIEQIIQVLVEAKITNLRIVKTPTGTSLEGQILTGEKLVVEGKIHQKIIYVAEVDDGSQPVHSAEFDVPFSTFIVVPEAYVGKINPGKEDQINVQACIEDVFVKEVNSREVIKSSLLFINAIFPGIGVNITTPEDGAEIPEPPQGDPILIAGAASDLTGITKLEIFINNVLENSFTYSSECRLYISYSDWKPTVREDTDYTIKLQATNSEGETASDTITVTVLNT